MGKGSNVQKKQAAQLKNALNKGKSEEERKLASEKAKKDAVAFMCELCRQTFMVNAKPPLLWQHVVAKHPPGTDPAVCFPVHMKDFDPEDPKGEKKAAAAAAAAVAGPLKPKKVVKKDDALDALLDSGLKKGKK